MPHIVVYNLLSSTIRDADKIVQVEGAINEAVLSVSELKLRKNDISYTFPEDSSVDETCPVIIIVELLFDEPERTDGVRQKLAKRIATHFFEKASWWRRLGKVEVAVKRFDPSKDGFFSL